MAGRRHLFRKRCIGGVARVPPWDGRSGAHVRSQRLILAQNDRMQGPVAMHQSSRARPRGRRAWQIAPILILLQNMVTETHEPRMVDTSADSSPRYISPGLRHLHPALRYMVGATCASGRSMPKSVSEWPMKRYPLGERYLQNLLRRLACVALSK